MTYQELFTLTDILSCNDVSAVWMEFDEPTYFDFAFEQTGRPEIDKKMIKGRYIYIFCEDQDDKIYMWHRIIDKLPSLNLTSLMRSIQTVDGDYRILINCNED